MFEKGQILKVKPTSKYHAGRYGIFEMMGTGPSEGCAILHDRENSGTLFVVGQNDVEALSFIEKIVEDLKSLKDDGDYERSHGRADGCILKLAEFLAEGTEHETKVAEAIKLWEHLPKWYA